jgi:small subunit ribosomal protein S16
MSAKIRLSRHGKTHSAFYHIVVADGRAPRDGRFIEKLGTYNPVANPAEIVLDFDKALDWIQKGAQPTDTVRTILSLKGVMYKHHLLKGVKKEAFSETEAESKFQKWIAEKEAKIAAKRSGVDEKNRADQKAKLDAEVKVNEDRAAEISKKKTAEIDAKVKAAQEAAAKRAAEEEAANPKAEVIETPIEEVKKEAKEEAKTEAKEEVKKEATAETKEEPKAETEKKVKAETKEEPKAE